MSELPLLTNLGVALGAALLGGVLARAVRLPPVIGYLVGGIAIGPFTPGFIGNQETISQLAELGVIFLLFGVGLHFPLADLWRVRAVALPGAIGRMLLIGVLGALLAVWWGWSLPTAVVVGLAIAPASTVILLRGLESRGLTQTPAGQMAVGWLVVEDLVTVLLLVLLPAVAPVGGSGAVGTVALALLKVALFVGMMLLVGMRAVPWLLLRVARMQSRELFLLTSVVLIVGIALAAARIFGVSVALGAFLAGVVMHESEVSTQLGGEVAPFREVFTVLFFVSVGMLVDPFVVMHSALFVAALVALVIVGKALLTLVAGLVTPLAAQSALVVAAGSAQIGEFTFIIGQAGVGLGLLTSTQYSALLAAAVLSILLNPAVFRLLPWAEHWLRASPALWRRLDAQRLPLPPTSGAPREHVVVIGCGRVGSALVGAFSRAGIASLVVEMDIHRASALAARGEAVLYGDAANSEVLGAASLATARACVVTVPTESTAEVLVAKVHALAPGLPIIVRTATWQGVARLRSLGAHDVIFPEVEGAVELLRGTLHSLHYPEAAIQPMVEEVRSLYTPLSRPPVTAAPEISQNTEAAAPEG